MGNVLYSTSPFPLTIYLSLPNGVGHSPKGSQDVEDEGLVGVGHPREEGADDSHIDDGAEDKHRHATYVLDLGDNSA